MLRYDPRLEQWYWQCWSAGTTCLFVSASSPVTFFTEFCCGKKKSAEQTPYLSAGKC